MGGGGSSKERLRLSIDYPHFKFNFEGGAEHLVEVRKIVEACSNDAEPLTIEDANFFELKSRLTEEFFKHPPLLSRLKSSLVMDEDVRVLKHVLRLDHEYDLETGKESRQVNVLNVKQSIAQLFEPLDAGSVRECLVHLHGDLTRDQQSMILDAIKQRLGMGVKTRFFSTKKELEGNALIEAVCFGDSIEEW